MAGIFLALAVAFLATPEGATLVFLILGMPTHPRLIRPMPVRAAKGRGEVRL